MEITVEQLEAYRFAKGAKAKTTDEDSGDRLGQVLFDAEGRAVATDGEKILVIKRPVGDAEQKAMKEVHMPGGVARGVLEACKRNKRGSCDVKQRGKQRPDDFQVQVLTEDEGALAVDYRREHDTYPDWKAALTGERESVEPRAQVAISSKALRQLCGVRSKVGGDGPIVLSVFGPMESVYASWQDENGHRVLAVLKPIRVESSTLESATEVP